MVTHMLLFAEHGTWYSVDGPCGSTLIPADVIGPLDTGQDSAADLPRALAPFYDGAIWSIATVTGWAARYSAPGYMDCTEWCGPYDTEDDALAACAETYGDDDEERGIYG